MADPDLPYLVLIMMTICLAPVAIVLIVLHYRRTTAALRYKTALDLAERGVAIPQDLLLDKGISTGRHGDLRTGLVLALGGAGVILYTLTSPEHTSWGFGLIPLCAGLGYLGTWYLSKADRAANRDA